jgi:hypothetical protein
LFGKEVLPELAITKILARWRGDHVFHMEMPRKHQRHARGFG